MLTNNELITVDHRLWVFITHQGYHDGQWSLHTYMSTIRTPAHGGSWYSMVLWTLTMNELSTSIIDKFQFIDLKTIVFTCTSRYSIDIFAIPYCNLIDMVICRSRCIVGNNGVSPASISKAVIVTGLIYGRICRQPAGSLHLLWSALG